MDRASLNIPAADGKWGSYISKYPPDSAVVGNSAFTTGSRNLITSQSGQAEKRQGGILWNPSSLLSGPALDQFEGVFSNGIRLFIVNDAGTLKASTGNGIFAPITGGSGFAPNANFEFATFQDRIYGCNGVNPPIVIDTATSYGGVTYPANPAVVSPMGLTAPSTAPTPGVPSAGGNVPVGSHTYAVSFLYYNSLEESNLGPVSSVVVVANPNKTVALTALPIGGYGVTGRNIYRDNNDGNYLLLDTILNNTTTTYTDVLAIGSTPTPAPTQNFGPPTFKYLTLYLDRMFVIDVAGTHIYWSLPGQPDVFYPQNGINGPADDIMTGFGMLNGLPYVFGQHTVGTILGTTDSSFYYSSISTRVGCVDNRSIQARLIVSVPKLIWLAALPNRGIYYTNGSTVEHLSDNIQDLTFNLAQISYLSRINSQTSQVDFEAGTSTPGIDLTTNPGTIQTINPKALYSRADDWQTGTLSNLSVVGDQLEVPTQDAPTLASGSLSGAAIISGSNVTLPAVSNLTGETLSGVTQIIASGTSSTPPTKVAYDIIPTSNGTLATLTMMTAGYTPSGRRNTLTVWNDAVGQPGSVIYSTTVVLTVAPLAPMTVSPGLALLQGVRYWIGFDTDHLPGDIGVPQVFGVLSGGHVMAFDGVWRPGSETNQSVNPTPPNVGYTYTQTPVASSGGWASTIFDSKSNSLTSGMAIDLTGSYPSPSTGTVTIQGSNNQTLWTTTDTLTNPTSPTAITGGNYRYWQILYSLSTTDKRFVPAISSFILTFNTTGSWESPPINTTTDTTAFNALDLTAMTPAGTTALIEMATSALSGSGYSSYGPIGSAVPNAYAKIRVTLTASTGDVTSPTLVSAELNWTVVSTFVSSIVDTGQVPNGWGIFQYEVVAHPASIDAFFRTASTAGTIPAATFDPITNGGFPTSPVNEFFQYKLVLTATADAVPMVDSVVTTWLLSSGTNVRAASLFFNKSYYLAVAMQGSPTNNLLIEYDYQDNWRIHDGVNIGTMATYFNDIYYCDATNGNVYNGFRSDTDNGVPIVMRLRSKCFDLGNNLQMKTARSVKVTGVNTGTFLTVSYSVDRGSTWNNLLNSSGTLGYQTGTDGSQFIEYFIPVFDGSIPISGRTIMYEIVSSDAFPCAILQITPTVYVHKGKAVREAMSA